MSLRITRFCSARYAILLIVIATGIGPATISSAQTSVPETVEPDLAIELAQVPAAVTDLEKDISEYARTDNSELIEEIVEGMPAVQETVLQASRRLISLRGHSVSSQRVVAVRTSLAASERQLDTWQEALSSSISRIEDGLQETELLLDVWERTRERAIEQEAPGTLITQVRASLSALNRAIDQLHSRREIALENQGNVGIELRRITRINKEIETLMTASRSTLFSPDSPPLWQLFAEKQPQDVLHDLRRYVVENFEVLEHWAQRHLAALSLWAASFGLALIFILSARHRHLEKLEADPRLQTSTTLAKHPISTSVLIALLLVPIILRERTEAFSWITTILAVPALLRLIPALIPVHTQVLARGIVAVYLLVRLAYLFPESSNPARLLYLISEVTIVVGGIRFLNRAKDTPQVGALLRTIMRVMTFLAAVAFGAHLFGYSLLGATLIQGAASSAFLGLALRAILSVAEAFFRLLAIVGPLQHLQSVKLHYAVMERQLHRILFGFILALWVINSLRAFTVQEIVATTLQDILQREWQFGSVTLTLGAIGWFFLSVALAVVASRLIRFFLENDVLSRLGLPRGVPSTISMMLHYAIVSLGFLLALAALGIELSQLSILIGALGVGIGFGLQNVVNNFTSGLILVFERPISVGDVVQIGTTTGKVTRIGLRSSVVRNFEGAEIIVPNGNLISSEVTNWTLSDEMRRITIPINVPFDTDADQLIELLETTANAHELVSETPEPRAVLLGFGESASQFSLRCWAHSSNFAEAKGGLTVEVDRALKKAGIKIQYPQRELLVRNHPGPEATDSPLETRTPLE
jgi:potassium-dependent mechanosensitive channel